MPDASDYIGRVNLSTRSRTLNIPKFTTYNGQKILPNMSPRMFARKILHHNRNTQFTPVLFIGASGSGKTTCFGTLIHYLHEIGASEFGVQFGVKHLEEGTLQNIEEVFKTMPKKPTIVIADDVSNELEGLPPGRRKQVFKAITTVRHDVGAPVIFVSAIHYSKALDKPLRNVSYTVFTSISDEELNNIDQLLGYKHTNLLTQFYQLYENMFEDDYFEYTVDGELQHCVTNQPLRICLAKRIKKAHFMVYDKLSCNICRKTEDVKIQVSAKEFYSEFLKAYGTRANNILMWWLFSHGYPEALAQDYKSGWNNLSLKFQQKGVDRQALVEELKLHRGQNLKKLTRPKQSHKEFKDQVLASIDVSAISA